MKLTLQEVIAIRLSKEDQRTLAQRYGVSRSFISSVRGGISYAKFNSIAPPVPTSLRQNASALTPASARRA